jgi:multicomponent Na+:H+ antiporter subunit F
MTVFVAAAVVIVVMSTISLYRVAAGSSVFDRVLAAGAIGTNAIALLALTGFIFERPDMFVDLAIAYGLLNFIGTVAITKYLEREGEQ